MCRIDLEGTFQIAEPGDLGRVVGATAPTDLIYLPPKHRPGGWGDSTGHAFLSFSPMSGGRAGRV